MNKQQIYLNKNKVVIDEIWNLSGITIWNSHHVKTSASYKLYKLARCKIYRKLKEKLSLESYVIPL